MMGEVKEMLNKIEAKLRIENLREMIGRES